jgi:hypothetical protein
LPRCRGRSTPWSPAGLLSGLPPLMIAPPGVVASGPGLQAETCASCPSQTFLGSVQARGAPGGLDRPRASAQGGGSRLVSFARPTALRLFCNLANSCMVFRIEIQPIVHSWPLSGLAVNRRDNLRVYTQFHSVGNLWRWWCFRAQNHPKRLFAFAFGPPIPADESGPAIFVVSQSGTFDSWSPCRSMAPPARASARCTEQQRPPAPARPVSGTYSRAG